MKNESVTAPAKQTYETPELTVFGQIEDLTKGNAATTGADPSL